MPIKDDVHTSYPQSHQQIAMEQQQFHLYLSSEDSKDLYPNNKPSSFVVQLPKTICLKGMWMCALCEVQYNHEAARSHENIYICSDLCEGSIVGKRMFPVLRQVFTKGKKSRRLTQEQYSQLYYVKVTKEEFNTITIHIKDRNGDEVSFLTQELNCILHFKKQLGFL